MNRLPIRSVSTAALMAMVATTGPPTAALGAEPPHPAPDDTPVRELRSLYTNEYGVNRPTGVTYDPERETFVVAGPIGSGGTELVEVTPTEDELRTMSRPNLEDGGDVAFDPKADRLVTDEADALPKVEEARGSTYSPDGTRYVLDAGSDSIVSVAPGGAVEEQQITGLAGADLNGIAYNPADDWLYVAESDASRLYAVDTSGRLQATHDLSGSEISDLEAMTFAPSADPTDKDAEQSLFVADAGDAETLGRVAELTLAPAVTLAADLTANLVATRDLSALTPPSPDSSGIAYVPGQDRLVVSDSEVNETALYGGENLFHLSRAGTKSAGGTTVPGSDEPTGTAFDPARGVLYTSDDDKKSVFTWSANAAGVFGTSAAQRSFKTSAYGNTDPEGIAVDTKRDHLLVVDGLGSEVFRLTPGANGVFDGVAPSGDDEATHYDMSGYGAQDPEGIEYDALRDTVLVLDASSEAIYELDENGSLLNKISVTAASPQNAAGLAVAPASGGGTAQHYYLVDRGVDNNSHPGENDGKMYEMAVNLAPITNRPPFASAGADQMIDVPGPARLEAAGTDLETPVNQLTFRWSQLSSSTGGTATLGTPNQAATTATFSEPGKYVLRVTVSDGEKSDVDDVVVDVYPVGGVRTTTIPISHGADDAQETIEGAGPYVEVGSADNEMGHDGAPATDPDEVITGLRFANLPVPQGSEIVGAKIQFKVDVGGSEPADYVIRSEASDNAARYTQGRVDPISARTMGPASVLWSPPAWPDPVPGVGGLAGPDQLTPELRKLVQQVVNRTGWAKGNAVNFTIRSATGTMTGRRTAEAKDGLTPPVLQLQFKLPAGTPPPPTDEPVAGCGTVAADICAQLLDYKKNLDYNLGSRVGPARMIRSGAMMEFRRGTVYWSSRYGAQAVYGGILNKYERLGGPSSYLGFPRSDEHDADVRAARVSTFARGRIYWSRGTGAHEVHGGIENKFVRLGGERAFGLPTSDERSAGVPGARMSRFTGGRIYWSRSTGAHEVHGGIENRYIRLGGPRQWGLPITDERGRGGARFSKFERAHIYWSRRTHARIVYGGILNRYLRMGGHRSWIGLPVREEFSVPGGRRGVFEHASIYWDRSGNRTHVVRR